MAPKRPADYPPCSLYRFYSRSDVLLYVGITGVGARRFSQHRRDKDWWQDVARIEVEHFPSREAAAAEERTQIINLAPRYNRTFQFRMPPGLEDPDPPPLELVEDEEPEPKPLPRCGRCGRSYRRAHGVSRWRMCPRCVRLIRKRAAA